MNKKIKFPLIMPDGVQVKELEELQENFDLETVIRYFGSGQLQQWLENNYNDEILEEIKELTGDEDDFVLKLTSALGVDYSNQNIDIQDAFMKSRLKNELAELYESEKLEEILDCIVENQSQLDKMLTDGKRKIYLYANKFDIYSNVKYVSFYGIKNPQVIIENYDEKKFLMRGLSFKDIEIMDSNGELIKQNSYVAIMDSVLDIFSKFVMGGKS